MGISMVGLVVNDLTFIITAFFSDHLPGGYWFLIVGFILEGLLGGKSCNSVLIRRYVYLSILRNDHWDCCITRLSRG